MIHLIKSNRINQIIVVLNQWKFYHLLLKIQDDRDQHRPLRIYSNRIQLLEERIHDWN